MRRNRVWYHIRDEKPNFGERVLAVINEYPEVVEYKNGEWKRNIDGDIFWCSVKDYPYWTDIPQDIPTNTY